MFMYIYLFICMFFMSVNVDGYSCISTRKKKKSFMLHAMTIHLFCVICRGGGVPRLWSMHPCLCWNICIPGGDKMIREMHYDVPFWIKWFAIVTTNNAYNILSDFPYSLTKTIHGFTANKTKIRGSCSYGWQPQIKHFVTSNTSLQRSIKIIFFVVIKTDPSQQQPLKWQNILYKNKEAIMNG